MSEHKVGMFAKANFLIAALLIAAWVVIYVIALDAQGGRPGATTLGDLLCLIIGAAWMATTAIASRKNN